MLCNRHYYTHFTDEEVEVWSREETCPRSLNSKPMGWDWNWSFWLQSPKRYCFVLFASLDRKGNWDSERVTDLPGDTQQGFSKREPEAGLWHISVCPTTYGALTSKPKNLRGFLSSCLLKTAGDAWLWPERPSGVRWVSSFSGKNTSIKQLARAQGGAARWIEPNSGNYIRAGGVICIWVMNVCVFGPDCPIYIWNLLIYY